MTNELVIAHLVRRSNIEIDTFPMYIMNLMKSQTIHQTGLNEQWTEVEVLKNANIVRIFSGGYDLLRLSSNGEFWGYGDNREGQLGLGDTDYFEAPDKWTQCALDIGIKIEIYDVACGYQHTFIIHVERRMYSFGSDQYNHCGHAISTIRKYYKPCLIETLKECKIEEIKCGP